MNENEIKIVVNTENNSNFTAVDDAMKRIGESADQASERVTRGFARARDSLGRFVKEGDQAGQALNPVEEKVGRLNGLFQTFVSKLTGGLEGAADSVFKFGSRIGDVGIQIAGAEAAGTAASSGINLLVQAVAGLAVMAPAAAGALAALAPILFSIGGIAGAAATALVGVVLALATLKIGFGGIGDALTAHTTQIGGAGKAATNTAEQQHQAALRIRDASRAVVDAKEREADAAKDVAKAIQDEIERREDLAIQLGLQKVSVSEAEQAVVEAEEKNRRAQMAGSDWEKTEAKNALARAIAERDAQKEKLGDLTKEKKKADTTSVEGSEKVQEALKRQTDAHEQVVRATERLTEAQRKQTIANAGAAGGINAFNDAMSKLSPNAQKLVLALIDIGRRFDKIKRQVQDRLLAGFDKEVTELADKWLPRLDDILGNMADKLNHFGKDIMGALGDSEFIDNIEQAGKDFGNVIDDMADGFSALIDAFGRLAGASGPVLKVISGAVRNIFVWFDKWIKRADETGKLDSFMRDAADMLQQIFDTGQKVFEIIGKVIAIIFPSSKETANSVFDSVNNALDKVSDWLGDPENQKKVEYFVDAVSDFIKWLVKTGIPIVVKLAKVVGNVATGAATAGRAIAAFGKDAGKVFNGLYRVVADFLNWLQKSAFKVGNKLGDMWDGLKNGFRNALNWVIQKWNSLSFGVKAGPIDFRVDTPDLQYFAKGGIAGGLIMAGEHGRELIRVPQGSSVMTNSATENAMRGNGGGGQFEFAFSRSSNKLMAAIIDELRLYVKNRGGQVQVALGRGKVQVG